MADKNKIKELLKRLDGLQGLPNQEVGDFADQIVSEKTKGLADQLRGDGTLKMLDGIGKKLDQFKSDFDLEPVNEAMGELRDEIGFIKQTVEENADFDRKSFDGKLESVRSLVLDLSEGNVKSDDLEGAMGSLSDRIDRLSDVYNSKNSALDASIRALSDELAAKLDEIRKSVPDVPVLDLTKDKEEISKGVVASVDGLRREMLVKLAQLGGGQANRNVTMSGSVLSRYGDLNFVGASFSNNDTTKMADVTFGGGSSSGSYSGADITVGTSNADYADIQSALDAVGASGGTIYVRAGTYSVTTGLLVKKSNTRLILSGGAIVQCNGNNVAKLISPNVTGLSRIEIWGGKWLQTNGTIAGTALDFSDASNGVYHPTRLEAFNLGIAFNDTTNQTFYNVYRDIQIFDCNNGISITGTQPNDNLFENIRIRTRAGGAGTGVALSNARGLTFINVDTEPATATGLTGFSFDATTREVQLINCWIENNAVGVSISNGAVRIKLSVCSITGNTLDVSNSAASGAVVFDLCNKTGSTLSNGVFSIPNGLNIEAITIAQNDSTNNPNAVTITNAGTGNSVSVTPTGNTGSSASTSGAYYLNNTSNPGIGANFYTNSSTFGTAGLVFMKSDNASSTGPVLRLDQDGTGPGLKINQNGNTGTTTGSSGGFVLAHAGTGFGLQVYSAVGAGNGALVHLETDNVSWDQPILEITTAGTAGGATNIKLIGPAPQIEWVESDQVSPVGKFETGVNGGVWYLASRNAGDSSFEVSLDYNSLATGGGMNFHGTTSGTTTLKPTAVAGSTTLTMQAVTDTLAVLGTAQNFTATQTGLLTGLGVTTQDAFVISNTTAAALGAQQISPSLHFIGQGWQTNTSASQSVDFRFNVLPVQGAASPTSILQIMSSVNGGAYSNALQITSAGATTTTGAFASNAASTSVAFQSNSTLANANFASITSGVASTSTATLLFGGASNVNYRVKMDGSVSTTLGIGNSYAGGLIIGSSPITSAASGTHAWLNNMTVKSLGTVTAGGATITNTATLYLEGAGTGGTNNYSLAMVGTTGLYNNVKTTGWGTPAIYGTGRSTAQTAAVASVAAYTVGAADGSFLVSANVLVTTATVHSFTVTVAYTDEGNTARTVTLQFSTLAGAFVTAIANAAGAVPYEGVPLHIRCKASTAITIATTGTFTTVTYNVEGNIVQIS